MASIRSLVDSMVVQKACEIGTRSPDNRCEANCQIISLYSELWQAIDPFKGEDLISVAGNVAYLSVYTYSWRSHQNQGVVTYVKHEIDEDLSVINNVVGKIFLLHAFTCKRRAQ